MRMLTEHIQVNLILRMITIFIFLVLFDKARRISFVYQNSYPEGIKLSMYCSFLELNRSTERYSKLKSSETRQVQERLVSTLETQKVRRPDKFRKEWSQH